MIVRRCLAFLAGPCLGRAGVLGTEPVQIQECSMPEEPDKKMLFQGWYSLFPLSDEVTTANIVGWTALVGGTLFEAGAYAMVVEAVNRGHTVRFGYEV